MIEEYNINKAYINNKYTEYNFIYDKPRDFQKKFIDWLNKDNSESIISVNAPTGAGKTAMFKQLIKDSSGIVLLIYPTNTLIKDQKDTLEKMDDISVNYLTSDKLHKHGIDRSRELKNHFRDINTDVIITNPDIIQSVIQGLYVDPVGDLLEIFEYCSGIVYDEFHFYDNFTSSGIILQTKIIENRLNKLGNVNIVFSSATPNVNYYEIFEKLDLDYKSIQSNICSDTTIKNNDDINNSNNTTDNTTDNTTNKSKFRCDTKMYIHSNYIKDNINNICKSIEKNINNIDINKNEYQIAVICNSVKISNLLYNKLINRNTNITDRIIKDNGYDTNDNTTVNMKGSILITTSKAEVGLDHDIQYLYMDEPYNDPDSFIQRFGRAGRDSKANIHVYGLGKLNLKKNMSYKQFVDNIYDIMEKQTINTNKIIELIGLRSAYAIYIRENIKTQSKKDLQSVPKHNKWLQFIQQFKSNSERYVPREIQNIVSIINYSLENLKYLRGQSTNIKVKYQKGTQKTITNYSLLSVLNQYNIQKITNNNILIVNEKNNNNNITIKYPINKFEMKSLYDLYQQKQNILRHINNNTLLSQKQYNKSLLLQYVQIMNINNLLQIQKIHINTNNGSQSLVINELN